MTHYREILLRAAANEVGIPSAFAIALAEECSWLTGFDEIGESIGVALLCEQSARFGVDSSKLESFLFAFNARVREHAQR